MGQGDTMPNTVATGLIGTERLEMRPFTTDMISDRYVGWLSNPKVVRYSEQRHKVHTRESCEAFINSFNETSNHIWAIHGQEGHAGNITAHRDQNNGTADIGILIGETAIWGRGYGTEAWCAVCRWLELTGIRKITAGTMAANKGMLRIFAKAGMNIEAIRPGHFLLDGEPEDLVLAGRF